MTKLSFKQKYRIALGMIILVVLFAWFGSIKKTRDLKMQVNEIKNDIDQLNEAPERVNHLKKMLLNLDAMAGICDSGNIDGYQVFLLLSEECNRHKVSIREIPAEHSYVEGDIMLKTFLFKVEGEFINMLCALNEFKKRLPDINLVSVEFYTEENKKTKVEKLKAELRIQVIIKT